MGKIRTQIVKEVDNLTIGVEEHPEMMYFQGCDLHHAYSQDFVVVRYKGELCNVAIQVCTELNCPEAAINQAKNLALNMIPKGQLKVVHFFK